MEEWERRVAPGQSLETFERKPAKVRKVASEEPDGYRRTGRGLRPLNP